MHQGPQLWQPGEQTGRFCAAHKLGGMVNEVSKVCEHEGCTKIPSFGNPGEKGVRFCAAHKLRGMVDVRASKRPAADAEEEGATTERPASGSKRAKHSD